MRNTRLYLFATIGLVLFVVFAVPRLVFADTGPKPSMQFNFVFKTSQPLTITGGQQLECDKSDCSDASDLGQLGPQGFSCTATKCSSMAYGYSKYHQLVINFSDKPRTSNVFTVDSFDANLTVTVNDSNLVIGDSSSPIKRGIIPGWIAALCITLIIESAFTVLVVRKMIKQLQPHQRRFLLAVVVANVISLPLMWFVLCQVNGGLVMLVAAELAVVFFEAGLYFFILRRVLTFGKWVAVSFFLNAMSFVLGGLILFVLLPRDVSSIFVGM